MKIKHIISFQKLLICFAIMVLGISYLPAQQKNTRPLMSGKVTDTFGNPILGAEVHLLNSDKMAVTNATGNFSFTTFEQDATFIVSLNGYQTTKVILGDSKTVSIALKKDVSNKDQIISGVYSAQPAYSVTSSIATISGDELNKTPYINLAAALVGRLPGLLARQTNAEPGSEDYSLNIRGNGTPNGKNALVLIDGVRSDNLQSINPRDVESVTIYKDAASNVLYGMQASSGIISIITKRGDFGKPRIRITADNSYQQPLKTPDMLHAWEYAKLRNEAYKNDGYGDNYKYSAAQVDSFKTSNNKFLYPDNNWYTQFMEPMVKTQRYNLSATGGIDGLKYYTNVGYSKTGSPYKSDGDASRAQAIEKFNFRSNVDVRLNKYIGAYMKISGQVNRTGGSTTSSGDILSSIFNVQPTVYGPLTPAGQVISTPQETDPTYGRINKSGYIKQTGTRMNTILGVNFNLGFITKGLSAEAMAMFDATATSTVRGTTGYERWMRDETRQDSLKFIKQGTQLATPLSLGKSSSSSYMSNSNAVLKYERTFGQHTISAISFVRYQVENRANLDIIGILPYQRLTYGGRVNYGFSNVLFAELAASYEGSEQFHPDRRFGFFPAASVAYVISNHDFLKDNKVITNLKLRASTGIVGNDQLGAERFLYKDNISKSGTSFIGALTAPVNENQKGNSMLTWEKSHKTNLGLELALWNQLTFGLDVFNEDRTDILVSPNSVPIIQGIPTANLAPINKGRVLNQGFEVQLGYNKAFSKDFSMSLMGYVDYNKNTTKISDELPLGSDYAYQFRTLGYSLGQSWGYLIDKTNGNGYFNSAEEITKSGLTYEGRAPRPGDFIYQDLNSDSIINAKDQAPIGNTSTPQISWGANLNLKYKNFDLSVLVQGIGMQSQFYNGLGFYDNSNGGTYFDMHRNAWTPERFAAGEVITSPALSVNSSASNRANDYYLADKHYTRLKNVELGYQIPTKVAKLIKTEAVRIYVQGNNLLTFDNMKFNDLDVEMSTITAFPTSRTFNVGLNVTF